MTQEKLLEYISSRETNEKLLRAFQRRLERMGDEQCQFYLDKVSSVIMDSGFSDEEKYIKLRASAQLVSRELDPSPLIEYPYELWERNDHYLAHFQDDENVKIQAKKNVDFSCAVLSLSKNHEMQYVGTWCYGHNSDFNEIPLQGYKLHISANDKDDYLKLLNTVVPEFEKLGVAYKIASPTGYDILQRKESTQNNKFITIYPNKSFDFSKFSKELKDILNQDAPIPTGEKQLCGRMSARYGRFLAGPVFVLNESGKPVKDERGKQSAAEFSLSEKEIFDFYKNAENKYKDTGNKKAYIQESATMMPMKDSKYLFYTFEAIDKSIDYTESLSEDFVCSAQIRVDGKDYIVVSKHDIDDNNYGYLTYGNDEWVRPEWDYRYNMYQISSKDVDKVWEMLEYMDERDAFAIKLQNGEVGVCVCLDNDNFDVNLNYNKIAFEKHIDVGSLEDLEPYMTHAIDYSEIDVSDNTYNYPSFE